MSDWLATRRPGDLIVSRPLNSTKVAAVAPPALLVVVEAASAAFGGLTGAEGPLAALDSGQRLTLYLGVLATALVLVVADMAVRAYTTGRALDAGARSTTTFPAPVRAHRTVPGDGAVVPGHIAAVRPLPEPQFLFVGGPGPVAEWVPAAAVVIVDNGGAPAA